MPDLSGRPIPDPVQIHLNGARAIVRNVESAAEDLRKAAGSAHVSELADEVQALAGAVRLVVQAIETLAAGVRRG